MAELYRLMLQNVFNKLGAETDDQFYFEGLPLLGQPQQVIQACHLSPKRVDCTVKSTAAVCTQVLSDTGELLRCRNVAA